MDATPTTRSTRRRLCAVAASLLVLATSTAVAVGSLASETAQAVAGSPGNPGLPTVIFTEDFENNGSTTVDPPVLITGYTGATGETYTASNYWANLSTCNGFILSRTSAPATVSPTFCANSQPSWNTLRILSNKLTNAFGGPGDLFTVASYTAGSGVAPDDYLQLGTVTPIALPSGGAFLTTSIDSGAYYCNVAGPEYYIFLTDASGVRHQVVSTGINPCNDPDAIVDNSIDGRTALLVRTVGDAPQMIDSSSVQIEIENRNVNGGGNDATFDNLQLLDVSPQLDKSFESPVPYGTTSTVTFTVTNTYSPSGDGSPTQLDPKIGWQFNDQLPSGLTVVGTPTTGSGTEACANFSAAGTGGSAVVATGDLLSGQKYCTVLAEVTASAPGNYTNVGSAVTTVGLKLPLDATVTFTASPSVSVVKSATLNDVNNDAVANVGDTIGYAFLVRNLGNVPLADVAIDDPFAGSVTCSATTIPVGGSVLCAADTPHAVTQAEVDDGQVPNTATVTAADSFNPATVVTSNSNVSTLLAPAPKLRLVKAAQTPVDTNSSGLVDAGDTIQYTFAVTNTGNVTVSGIAVDDPLVGSATCIATTLTPGASTDCAADAVYTVTDADETAGSVVNTASASGSTPSGATVTSNGDSSTTAVSTPSPSLMIVKTADAPVDVNSSGLTDAGDTIQYRFTVSNSGNVPLGSVAVSDPLTGPVTCAATALAVEESTTCVADSVYTVTADDESSGAVVNAATATASDPDGGAVTSPADSTTTAVTTPAPGLVIDKSADPPVDVNSSGLVDAGDTIQYRFVVTNNGNVPIADVAVSDALAGAVTCVSTALAPAESTTCAAESAYTVTDADETATAVTNSASASGLDPDGAAVASNTDSTTTAVDTPDPSLVIDKSADPPVDANSSGLVDAGDTIQYRFVVSNNGNVPITVVGVTDALAGTVTCEVTDLAPGESTPCAADSVVTVAEADEDAGELVNSAAATGLDPDGGAVPSNSDSTTTAIDSPAPELSLTKTAEPPTDVNSSTITDAGDTIRYTFVLTNTGNVPIDNITITDDLAGDVACVTNDLMPGQSTDCIALAVYTVTAADEEAGEVINSAAGSGSDPDGGVVTSNTASTSTAVETPAPSLALTKTAGTPTDVNASGLTDAGDTIAYAFTVTNTGNVPISGVRVDDPRIGSVSCGAANLAVGATTDCVSSDPYVVTAADETAGSVDNNATAFGTSPDNVSIPSNTATASTRVDLPAPDLSFTKTAAAPVDVNASGLVDEGDTIEYTFTVTNNGNVPISDVAVADDKVGAVTCGVTTLAVDDVVECVADAPYTITAEDEVAGVVENTASAQGRDPDGGDVTSPADTAITPVATPAPSLVIEKIADDPVDENSSGLTDAGDTISYRFVVTNNGNVPLADVAVTDELVGAVTCATTTLRVGEATNCAAEAPHVVTTDDEAAGQVVNVASASGADPDQQVVSSEADSTTTAVTEPSPSLAIVKTADAAVDVNDSGLVDAGDTIQYRFVVTNTGDVPISGVAVSDDLAGPVTCEATTLAPAGNTDCVADSVYTVSAADEAAGAVVNTATGTGLAPDGGDVTSPADSTTTAVSVPRASLLFEKLASVPIDVNGSGITDAGDTIQYSFTVTNNGDVPLSGVTVDDGLIGSVTCAATTLAANQTTDCVADQAYVITVDDETSGTVANVASAAGADPDGVLTTSNEDSTTTPVSIPAPGLSLVKEAMTGSGAPMNAPMTVGDAVQFRFTVTNSGNVIVTTLNVSDPMVGSVTCDQTTLAVGENTACSADAPYYITDADVAAGSVTNTAKVSANTPNGTQQTASDPSSVTVMTRSPSNSPSPKAGAAPGLLVGVAGALLVFGLVLLAAARWRRFRTALR